MHFRYNIMTSNVMSVRIMATVNVYYFFIIFHETSYSVLGFNCAFKIILAVTFGRAFVLDFQPNLNFSIL